MSRLLAVLPILPFLLTTALAFQPPQPPRAATPRTRPIFYQQIKPLSHITHPAARSGAEPILKASTQQLAAPPSTVQTVAATSAASECQCVHCRSQRRSEQHTQAVAVPAVATVDSSQPSLLSRLTQTSHNQMQPTYISEDPTIYSSVPSSCCSDSFCDSCCSTCYDDSWLSLEALVWWSNGSDLTPLATQSPNGTIQANAGLLGRPDTTVLFGGNDLFTGATPGYRLRGGKTIDGCSGIDFEVFQIGSQNESFFRASNGDPILTRPFTNALTGLPDSELVGFPGFSTGSLRFRAESRFWSAAAHFYRLAEEDTCCDDGDQFSAAIQIGPRFMSLKEDIYMEEFVTGSQVGVQNLLIDSFETDNAFFGGEIGLQLQRRTNRTFMRGGVRLALGATQQELQIAGRTIRTDNQGARTEFQGGLAAQRTNSGSYSRNRFSVIPQGEFTLGYETRWGWEVTVGYNLLYWTKVLRATEQIDPVLNPNLLPPEVVPFSGPSRPAKVFRESGYLAHGISLGIEKRY